MGYLIKPPGTKKDSGTITETAQSWVALGKELLV